MINGQDRRRPGLLPGQRGGRCHRRPAGGNAYSSRRLVRTLLSMRSLGAVGVPHSPLAFEWPFRSSIPERLSLGLQGPQCLVEIVLGWSIEGRETKDDRRFWCPTVVSDRSDRGTGRSAQSAVVFARWNRARRVDQLAGAVTVSNPTRRTQRRQISG